MSLLKSFILPPPPAQKQVPPEEMHSRFSYWRDRLLWSTYIGYAVSYLMRKNLSAALPAIQRDMGVDLKVFGVFFTVHEVTYGLSKFLAGILADRFNPRFLICLGMLLAALANLGFGLGNSVTVLGIAWVVNGFFQGFGFPPCARILSHWFAPSERGVKWGIFNTSHQVGAFAALGLSGWLCVHYGWRSAFIVPAMFGIITSLFLLERVRDTPASLGLPTVEVYKGEVVVEVGPAPIGSALSAASDEEEEVAPIGALLPEPEEESLASFTRRQVYLNPQIWLICIANFFVYVVRASFLNWAPTYLNNAKGLAIHHAGYITSIYELAGLFGCLLGGWVTDRFWGGRRAPACVFYMAACALFIVLFWQTPKGNPALDTLWLAGVGFTVYGPQFLVGVMMADLATKRAAGTAVGLSGLFGYMSGFVSGIGLSLVQSRYDWDGVFGMLTASSLIAMVPFVLTWNAKPAVEK